MDAGEAVRKGLEQVAGEILQIPADVGAVNAVRDTRVFDDLVAVIDHVGPRVAIQPPVGSVRADAGDEQDLRVDGNDLPAEVVQRHPVDGRLGRCPTIRGGEGDQVYAHVAGQRDLAKE